MGIKPGNLEWEISLKYCFLCVINFSGQFQNIYTVLLQKNSFKNAAANANLTFNASEQKDCSCRSEHFVTFAVSVVHLSTCAAGTNTNISGTSRTYALHPLVLLKMIFNVS